MQITAKDYRKIFIWGMILGALCHLVVYGPWILNPCQDFWIMRRGEDIRQHYVGWLMFRSAPWRFPLGLIDSLSYPTEVSIVYTDSIPLFAVFFKLLSPVLPQTFQYFGLFGLLSFVLMGGFSARVILRATGNRIAAGILPLFFILSVPMLQRTYYHTSLSAQWIILLCLDLWFSGICGRKMKRQILIWALVGALCASIHTYFLPMAFGILCGALLEEFLKGKRTLSAYVLPIASLMGSAALVLFVLGAFSGSNSASYEVGIFGMNLNSFFNPMSYSRFFDRLPLATPFQYEGTAYLGLGGILMLAGLIALGRKWCAGGVRRMFAHPRRISILVIGMVFLLVSVSPLFSFGDRILFTLNYPGPIASLMGIFRSNGRFIWPLLYLIYLAAMKGAVGLCERCGKRLAVTALCLLLCLLQLTDLSKRLMKKHETFAKQVTSYGTDWDRENLPDSYRHFFSYQDDVMFLTELGYYAGKHDMTLSRFYFARNIDEITEKITEETTEALLAGEAEADTVYILDQDSYGLLKDCGLYFYPSEKCVYGTKDPIPGKEELTEETLAGIEWPEE